MNITTSFPWPCCISKHQVLWFASRTQLELIPSLCLPVGLPSVFTLPWLMLVTCLSSSFEWNDEWSSQCWAIESAQQMLVECATGGQIHDGTRRRHVVYLAPPLLGHRGNVAQPKAVKNQVSGLTPGCLSPSLPGKPHLVRAVLFADSHPGPQGFLRFHYMQLYERASQRSRENRRQIRWFWC